MVAAKRICLGTLAVLLLVTTRVGGAERNPRIKAAMDRGVAYLKGIQQANGWGYDGQSNTGLTALVGLTLLECGVPADDPTVKKAADIVRQNAPTLGHTYSLSISIWFFDALGEEADVPLIESMAVRLLAGQKAEGGWRYTCPPVSPDEERRLTDLLKQRNVLKGGKELPKKGKEKEQGKRRHISPEIQQQLAKLVRQVAPAPQKPAGGLGAGMEGVFGLGEITGDNSNTQFAVLGLWVARRYGMPVDDALAKVEARFRKTQLTDGPQIGGWEYIPGGGANILAAWSLPPAMTCSGLIGLAVGHGLALDAAKEGKARKHIDPDKDKHLKAAFMNLGWWLEELRNVTSIGGKYFYFLWSLERVAEVYGLDTIGKKDWYAWGSNLLLRNQAADGGWHGEYAQGPDTCFALLFLARANVAKDLTVSLRNKFKDPGMHALKAGGVDPATLQKKGVKVAGSDKKPSDIPKLVEPKKEKSGGDGRDARPTAAAEGEDEKVARKKSDELINAPAAKQEELLEQYKQSKGAVYTLALAGAIPKLSAKTKAKAREALAERLTRMTAATLRAELKNDDPEIRRAASLACAMKDDKAHIPDLIPLLEDPEPLVSRAVHEALKSLSNEDFGPDKDATDEQRAKAVADWNAWWKKQGEK